MYENVYYSPEKHGLTLVDEIELSSGEYEFDIVAVWKDSEGKLLTARSSGCSCPTPFEEFNGVEDLEIVNLEALENEVENSWYRKNEDPDVQDFLRKVREAG